MANTDYDIPKFWSIKSTRLMITLTFGMATFSNFCLRNSLNMAMVCMVSSLKNTSADSDQHLPQNSSCTLVDDLQNDYQGTFNWGTFEQGVMFGALYLGGFIATVPVGYMADRSSPKLMVTVGLFGSSLGSLLSPIAANHGGFIALAIVRVFMGIMTQSTVYTCISVMIQHWIPPNERSTTIALFTAGGQVASILVTPINAFLCHSATSTGGGWSAIFYFSGSIGLVSVGLWLILATDNPDTHRFITDREKAYIKQCLSSHHRPADKHVKVPVPWRAMLLSPAVAACLVQDFSCGIFQVTLQNYLPTYYKEALFLSLYSNGLVSALPPLCQWVGKMTFATLADFMKRKTTFSHTTICKLFNTLNCIGTVCFLIICGFMDCTSATWAVLCICLIFLLYSSSIPGFLTSLVSVAPAYSGVINSLSSFSFQLSSLASPIAIAALTEDGDPNDWQHVFWLVASAQLVAGIVFFLFGSAEVQKWAEINKKDEKF